MKGFGRYAKRLRFIYSRSVALAVTAVTKATVLAMVTIESKDIYTARDAVFSAPRVMLQ